MALGSSNSKRSREGEQQPVEATSPCAKLLARDEGVPLPVQCSHMLTTRRAVHYIPVCGGFQTCLVRACRWQASNGRGARVSSCRADHLARR